METYLKRSIRASCNKYFSDGEGKVDLSKHLDGIFPTSTSFIEVKRVIVWFFLISDCTIFKGKLRYLVDNVKRMDGTFLVTLLKIVLKTDYIIFKKEIFSLDLPKKYEVLLGNTESTLIERAYAINNPDVVVNSTYIERSKPKRSKTSKVDMNKLNQMVTYIYDCTLSTRSEDISLHLERNEDGSYMPLEEEATLICKIQNNLQQMADSRMRFKTYRYYQVLLSFINATSSLIKEFQYLKLDNEAFFNISRAWKI